MSFRNFYFSLSLDGKSFIMKIGKGEVINQKNGFGASYYIYKPIFPTKKIDSMENLNI